MELIKKVKEGKESYRSVESSKEQIQQQCMAQGDVAIDSVRVSLKCQFDSMMIETPARGRFCDHIQCFSLENIIKMTSSATPRKWKCPICKLHNFELVIDSYQMQLIQEFRNQGLGAKEITFDRQGNVVTSQAEKIELESDNDDE